MSANVPQQASRSTGPSVKGFVFDIDGTLALGDRALGGYEALPGAIEVLTAFRERAVPFVLLTNGSARTPAELAGRLRHIGLPVEEDRLLTPSSVAADYFSRRGIRRALVLGTRAVGQELRDAGIETVHTGEPKAEAVGAVYVGWHPECTMQDIETACHAIWSGARLYVASDVPFFATRQGRSMGYSHAIAGAIRRVTRAPVVVMGKPSLHAMRLAAGRLGLRARELAVVGDDPLVEIVMARRAGATALAVTTGVTGREEWARQPEARRPHRVLAQLRDLLNADVVP